jgi:hypothetical protein
MRGWGLGVGRRVLGGIVGSGVWGRGSGSGFFSFSPGFNRVIEASLGALNRFNGFPCRKAFGCAAVLPAALVS